MATADNIQASDVIGYQVGIYLARVCQREDETLYIERKQTWTSAESYVAISHVWGDPLTVQKVPIDGAGLVDLSPGKRDLLPILRRPDVCGTGWFWLDLFCIDQSENASISISAQLMAIPAIYKCSTVVVVLIESPVCRLWAQKAAEIIEDGITDADLFDEEEARHARKCPNLVLMDPWFDRLWTRQEGLYAMKLRMVILNGVERPRLSTSRAQGDRWVAEGVASAKRNAVDAFILDKLAYHGVQDKGDIAQMCFYHDLVYKLRVDVTLYGGQVGPDPDYMPIREAWRSGRTTTKARDYVLAVFPDVGGYRMPLGARRLSFRQLFMDAYEQVGTYGRAHGSYILPKVPESMITTTASDANRPWILDHPANVTEAYDSIVSVRTTRLVEGQRSGFRRVKVTPFENWDRTCLEELLGIWESSADMVQHMVLAASSGPCIGVDRAFQRQEDLLLRFFAQKFAAPAVKEFCLASSPASPPSSGPPSATFEWLNLRAHGIVDLDKLRLANESFGYELKRFLVCLICGTTLTCATRILEHVEVVAVAVTDDIDGAKMLALVNRLALTGASPHDLVLGGNGFEDFQGLFLLSPAEGPGQADIVVGRTTLKRLQQTLL